MIAQWERKRAAGERFPFAVRDAGTGELLGGCELRPVGKGAASLAYWTYPAHRSRGVASRAVALACQVASEQLRFRQLEVVADPETAARAVSRCATDSGRPDCATAASFTSRIDERRRRLSFDGALRGRIRRR